AALPPPVNLAVRSITVTSACTALLSKLDIAAGLLATTDASLLKTALLELALPRLRTLFSRSWKPDASAWPNANAPAMPSARAEIWVKREWVYMCWSLSVDRFGVRRATWAMSPALVGPAGS